MIHHIIPEAERNDLPTSCPVTARVGRPGAGTETLMIETPRLILRPWRDADLAPFAALNADPTVMRFMRGVLTREDSDAYVQRARQHLADHGFCTWAVEAPRVAPFIGAIGLSHVRYEASFTPAVEVAWRLDRPFWGQGYATEAARAAIQDGFTRVGLKEIVAITRPANIPSQLVMQRLGMTFSAEFDHPQLPEDSPLRPHILYRLRAPGRGTL
jgi:RimJ/RimL family protein N-acetyltransferase